MKRFVFRLETVLRHRQIVSEQREQEFALAHGRYEVAQQKLAELETHRRDTVARRPSADDGSGFNAPAIHSREKYLEALSEQIERQIELVDIARMISEEKRANMVSARQAKEAVSRLRDKDLAAYQAEMEHKTQEALDEIASVRFLRQQTAEATRQSKQAVSKDAIAAGRAAGPDGRKAE